MPSIIGRKQYILLWIFAILNFGLLVAYSHERAENMNYKKVLLGCVNEQPFIFNADQKIGILCARDQKY